MFARAMRTLLMRVLLFDRNRDPKATLEWSPTPLR
jgi:hypothetical protein